MQQAARLYERDGVEHAAHAQLVADALSVELERQQLGVGLDAAHKVRPLARVQRLHERAKRARERRADRREAALLGLAGARRRPPARRALRRADADDLVRV